MRLDTEEARRRFAASAIARLATVSGSGPAETGSESCAWPHLVPVTFALTGPDTVVVGVDHKPKSTTDLKRLRNIAANPQVALLADRYRDDWHELWWARADGTARTVTRGAGHTEAWQRLRDRYPQYAGRPLGGPVILVAVHRWTGWAAGPAGRDR